ncbi:MAG: Hsp20/alpha crystallin family protein [Planctomycetota bacterium]|nr:MAG: Hsp20/alpha crystallin family protein [Planctomycetota bacterium]
MLSIIPSTFPTFARSSTFGELVRDVDRLFDAMTSRAPMSSRPWPGMNVWRDGDNIVAEAEIPGFTMDDIEVFATEDVLTIRGQRHSSTPEHATPLRLERCVNSFERSLRLPVEIDPDHVQATLVNGVLRVTLPVCEAARPRRVKIQALNPTEAHDVLPASSEQEVAATK